MKANTFNVLFISNMGAPFGGNYVESLVELDKVIKEKGGCTLYVFNTSARTVNWIDRFNDVLFTDWSFNSLKSIINIAINEYGINIIQYNFIEWKKALLLRFIVGNKAKLVFYFLNHIRITGGYIERKLKHVLCHVAFDNSNKICMTKGVAESVNKVSEDNVIVINNPIKLQRLDDVGVTTEIPTDDDSIRLLMFGNHYERKGVDFVVSAVEKIHKEGKKILLYIAADNPEDNYIYIEKVISDQNYKEYIKVIPTRNDIATYYKRIDILLSPSREEGWTWAIPEAMYCGCQVIASNISGQNEHNIPGIYWISDPKTKTFNEICNEIVEGIEKESLEKKSSSYAEVLQDRMKYLKENNNMQEWSKKCMDVYKKVLVC